MKRLALAVSLAHLSGALASQPGSGVLHLGLNEFEDLPSRARRRATLSGTQVNPLYQGYGTHYAFVWVGTPPQRVSVIVDTGSHYTAFPCKECKNCGHHTDEYFDHGRSSTYHQLGCSECTSSSSCVKGYCKLNQAYAEGSSWAAKEARDKFFISGATNDNSDASALAIDFLFGCQFSETGLFITQKADGIMGMSMNSATIVDQLVAHHQLASHSFSMCFASGDGVLTLGGTDPRLHLEDMAYVPLRSTSGWYTVALAEVWIDSVKVNAQKRYYQSGKGTIVDSGTTDTYLPSATHSAFLSAWTSAGVDWAFSNKKHKLTETEVYALPTIHFVFDGGVRVSVPPANYMELQDDGSWVPRLYTDEPSGAVLGANFMRGHDVHFDKGNKRIGFSRANCNFDSIPESESADCVMGEWEPVSSCEANCTAAMTMNKTVTNGWQTWSKPIEVPARGNGAPCPSTLPTERRSCKTRCGVAPTPAPTPGPLVCPQPGGWSSCDASCKEHRNSSKANSAGTDCVPEGQVRSCHVGACSVRGYKVRAVLLLNGAEYGSWDRDVEDDIEDFSSQLLGTEVGNAEVSSATKLSPSGVLVILNIVLVADLESYQRVEAERRSFDEAEGVTAQIQDAQWSASMLQLLKGSSAEQLQTTTKVDVVASEVLPNGDTRLGDMESPEDMLSRGALAAISVVAVLSAIVTIAIASIRHRRTRMRMISKGKGLVEKMKRQLGAHDYTPLSQIEMEAIGHHGAAEEESV